MFLGFAFGILTLFIPPMPGWYFWVVPFFVYFGVKHQRRSLLPLACLTVAYFLHFSLSPQSDYFELFAVIAPSIAALPNPYALLSNAGLPAALLSNLAFTLLQACLLANVALIYRYGVEEGRRKKLYNAPFLVGIAGDSGSGKTTLTRLLTDIFGARDVATVEGDALHRWERGNEMWKTYTHLDPKANALHEDLEHVTRLRAGEDTFRRHYDHKTGTFTEAERLPSKRLILFEGLHSFYLTSMATLLDLKVFIMPDDTLRTHWKLLRDVGERGYSKERVLDQLAARAKDAADYIASQEPLSDVTFTLRADNVTPATVGTPIDLALYLEVRCSNAINVDSLLNELAKQPQIEAEHKFVGKSQLIRLYGSCNAETIEQLSYRLTPELYDMTFHEPGWSGGYNGLMQLFLVYYIFASVRLSSHYEQTH
ncbi:hypothetical protein K2Q16_00305 [Patescibacteria group bacterium]|nr:hypothetical protein [Patescibacteria group bacterium]